MNPIHDAAARGFSTQAAAYASGRPDYPPALDDWLKASVHLGPGRTVVDLGAGTGKFVPRLATTGARVVAIEPVAQMLERLAANHPTVDARIGTAEEIPLADASVDAVVCAQAFHWFARAPAVREIGRVLKPGGVLALIWNVRDESVPWVRRLTDIVQPYEGDAPRFYKGDWRRVFPAPGFGPLRETRFEHVHVGTAQQVIVDRFLSVSFIAALPDAERAVVESRLRALIADEPTLAGHESIAFPYQTVTFCSIREA